MCAVANDLGISTADILARTELCDENLLDPDFEVSVTDEFVTARNLLAHSPDPELTGVMVGQRFNIASLGLLGFAVMSCPTLRTVMATATRFFSLTALHVRLIEAEDEQNYRLIWEPSQIPADLRQFFLAVDIAGAAMVIAPFLSETLALHTDAVHVELALSEQSVGYITEFLPIADISFGRPVTFVEFPASILDEPLPQADEDTLRICVAQVEELVARRQQRSGIAGDVRSFLTANVTGSPTIESIADSLHMHPRTLQRRLNEAGTSWRDLNNEVRATIAVELLSQVGLTVEEVADRLGYSETAAFTRAFTRWVGVPPSTYRQQRRRY